MNQREHELLGRFTLFPDQATISFILYFSPPIPHFDQLSGPSPLSPLPVCHTFPLHWSQYSHELPASSSHSNHCISAFSQRWSGSRRYQLTPSSVSLQHPGITTRCGVSGQPASPNPPTSRSQTTSPLDAAGLRYLPDYLLPYAVPINLPVS